MAPNDRSASTLDDHAYHMSPKQKRKRGGSVTGTAPKSRPDRRPRRADGGDVSNSALPVTGGTVPDVSKTGVPAINVSVTGGGPPKPPAPVQQDNPVGTALQELSAMDKLSQGSGPNKGISQNRRGGRVTSGASRARDG